MSKDFGLVSVVMPCYNCAAFIGKAIESVLSQSYADWELLVVDDRSSDDSVDIVRAYAEKDERIKLFVNSENFGAAKTRNAAIEKAKGKWIAFLDSDDYWTADKLLNHLDFMVKGAVSFSFTPYDVVNVKGEKISAFRPLKAVYTYEDVLKTNSIGCSTVIYDREKLGKVFMPEDAEKREDMACWLRILKSGEKCFCFEENLTAYRVGGESVSSSKVKMAKYQWRVYRKVERLSFIESAYLMCHWAINGLKKHARKKG